MKDSPGGPPPPGHLHRNCDRNHAQSIGPCTLFFWIRAQSRLKTGTGINHHPMYLLQPDPDRKKYPGDFDFFISFAITIAIGNRSGIITIRFFFFNRTLIYSDQPDPD
jgi:hypothetical protein